MTLSLSRYQDAFVDALYQGVSTELSALTDQPGFAIYRNSVLKTCIDALSDNFPSVERLVGTSWMRAAAHVHACQTPPDDIRLIHYGTGFADFLAGFEPARELPYLADVARLDRLWIEAFTAEDEPHLELTSLANVPDADFGDLSLVPRANVRWRWFADQPAYTLWHHNRNNLPLPETVAWQGEGALLVGGANGVDRYALERGAVIFLDACACHLPLDQACTHALQSQADLDFNDLLARLLAARVFAPLPIV